MDRIPLTIYSWLNNNILRNVAKRALTVVLAAWLHLAALWYLVMTVSPGANGSALIHTASSATVVINLQANQHTVPQLPPKYDEQNQVATAPQQIESVESTREGNPATSAKADDAPQKEGLLECEKLIKKPERIIFGEQDDYLRPDGTPPGYAILHETIASDGHVIAVTVEESTLSKKMLDRIIFAANAKYYHPGEIDGKPVTCDLRYAVSMTPLTN
jgi:hypothetical protein